MVTEYQDVLDFWFGENDKDEVSPDRKKLWFQGGEETDVLIAQRFQGVVSRAGLGELNHWTQEPKGTLALIILLDQFTRNIYRGLSAAFRYDALALALCKRGLALNQDMQLNPIERVFFYLPLEHSEALEDQEEAVFYFDRLRQAMTSSDTSTFNDFYQYAVSHHAVIKQFGRFPHRNAVNGRLSTQEELDWLHSGGQRFGQ